MKHMKEIERHAVIRKQSIKMINKATANGLEKEEIQHHLCNAWKCIFNEECLGLDDNGLLEEDSDLTGGDGDGAAGSVDVLLDNLEQS